jgi:uncharacterized membrane protein
MPQPDAVRVVRTSIRLMILGLVMLVGAVAGFAAHSTVAGAVFLVLMVLCGAVAAVNSLVFRNRARAFLRDARARQADPEATHRNGQGKRS